MKPCDKEKQNIAFSDKNCPSQDELSFLITILRDPCSLGSSDALARRGISSKTFFKPY